MKKTYGRILMLLAVVALSLPMAHAAGDGGNSLSSAKAVVKDNGDNDYFRYLYNTAMELKLKGNITASYELLRHCSELRPDIASVWSQLGLYESALKRDSLLLEYFGKSVELEPSNTYYAENLASVYINKGTYDKAIEIYENLLNTSEDKSSILETLAQLYNQVGESKLYLHTLDRLEAEEGMSMSLSMMKMSVYNQMGEDKKALAELDRLIAKNPYDNDLKVMKGNWVLTFGKKKEALAILKKVIAEDPDNIECMQSLADYYVRVGQKSEALVWLKKMVKSPSSDEKLCTRIVGDVMKKAKVGVYSHEDVLNIMDVARERFSNDNTFAYARVKYLEETGMSEDSVRAEMMNLLEHHPTNTLARYDLLQYYGQQEDYDAIDSLMAEGIKHSPEEVPFFFYYGLALNQKDKIEEARDILKKGASLIGDETDKKLAADMYGLLGDILHSLNDNKSAYDAYEHSLSYQKDNAGILNNYAYYLSVEKENLDKAAEMSLKAVQSDPTSATFLDTYSWVLYQQGKYDEARAYIDLTLENDTLPSAVLYEHAGDIYCKCGIMDKAVEYWQEALKQKPDNAALIEKKIKLRKVVEE